jgi:hypothetical protein
MLQVWAEVWRTVWSILSNHHQHKYNDISYNRTVPFPHKDTQFLNQQRCSCMSIYERGSGTHWKIFVEYCWIFWSIFRVLVILFNILMHLGGACGWVSIQRNIDKYLTTLLSTTTTQYYKPHDQSALNNMHYPFRRMQQQDRENVRIETDITLKRTQFILCIAQIIIALLVIYKLTESQRLQIFYS